MSVKNWQAIAENLLIAWRAVFITCKSFSRLLLSSIWTSLSSISRGAAESASSLPQNKGNLVRKYAEGMNACSYHRVGAGPKALPL